MGSCAEAEDPHLNGGGDIKTIESTKIAQPSKQHYDGKFFATVSETSVRSAEVIVPLVLDLLSVSSVVDVGCGLGAWLRVFQSYGVKDVHGIDGTYVNRDQLYIQKEQYTALDLSRSVQIDGHFDLAVSLEVAEHLPTSRSRDLIRALTNAAPAVLFSAAIPGQGGTSHVNEQWHWYWHALFAEHQFDCFDVVRPSVFSNSEVAWWFRQNIFLYAARDSQQAAALAIRNPGLVTLGMSPIADHVLAQYMTLPGLLKCLKRDIFRTMKNRAVQLLIR